MNRGDSRELTRSRDLVDGTRPVSLDLPGKAASAELALVRQTRRRRSDETWYPGENEEGGRRGKERRDRGEKVTRSSCVFAAGGAIIRSRHQKYQWRNGSLIPRSAPCQCLSSTSFISFILHFFVIPTYPPRHPVLLRGSAVCVVPRRRRMIISTA